MNTQQTRCVCILISVYGYMFDSIAKINMHLIGFAKWDSRFGKQS